MVSLVEFGLETEFGPVIVRLSGERSAYVEVGRYMPRVLSHNGKAHINDDRPALMFRGQEYIGSARLARAEDGTWVHKPSYPGDVFSKRPQWTNAPPTHNARMVEAVAAALVGYLAAHPEVLEQAGEAHRAREVQSLRSNIAELDEKIGELTEERTAAKRALRKLTGE